MVHVFPVCRSLGREPCRIRNLRGAQQMACAERSKAMNRTLTAAAALVASTAGMAGLAGTATADPAPGFPAAPTAHSGDWRGTLHTAMQSVGHVAPATPRATDASADDSTIGLPLINQDASPASLLNTVGGLTRKSTDTQGTAAPTEQSDQSGGGLPGADMLGNLGDAGRALGGQPQSRSGASVDPIATVEQLTGNVPLLGKINALGHG
jgi:hypothetical protein